MNNLTKEFKMKKSKELFIEMLVNCEDKQTRLDLLCDGALLGDYDVDQELIEELFFLVSNDKNFLN